MLSSIKYTTVNFHEAVSVQYLRAAATIIFKHSSSVLLPASASQTKAQISKTLTLLLPSQVIQDMVRLYCLFNLHGGRMRSLSSCTHPLPESTQIGSGRSTITLPLLEEGEASTMSQNKLFCWSCSSGHTQTSKWWNQKKKKKRKTVVCTLAHLPDSPGGGALARGSVFLLLLQEFKQGLTLCIPSYCSPTFPAEHPNNPVIDILLYFHSLISLMNIHSMQSGTVWTEIMGLLTLVP